MYCTNTSKLGGEEGNVPYSTIQYRKRNTIQLEGSIMIPTPTNFIARRLNLINPR